MTGPRHWVQGGRPRTPDPEHGTLKMAYRERSRTGTMCGACRAIYKKSQREYERERRRRKAEPKKIPSPVRAEYVVAVLTAARTQAPGDWRKVRELEQWMRS